MMETVESRKKHLKSFFTFEDKVIQRKLDLGLRLSKKNWNEFAQIMRNHGIFPGEGSDNYSKSMHQRSAKVEYGPTVVVFPYEIKSGKQIANLTKSTNYNTGDNNILLVLGYISASQKEKLREIITNGRIYDFGDLEEELLARSTGAIYDLIRFFNEYSNWTFSHWKEADIIFLNDSFINNELFMICKSVNVMPDGCLNNEQIVQKILRKLSKLLNPERQYYRTNIQTYVEAMTVLFQISPFLDWERKGHTDYDANTHELYLQLFMQVLNRTWGTELQGRDRSYYLDVLSRSSSYLNMDTFNAVMRYAHFNNGKTFGIKIRYQVLLRMITHMKIEDATKAILKCRYIDSYILGNIVREKFEAVMEQSYKEFHVSDIRPEDQRMIMQFVSSKSDQKMQIVETEMQKGITVTLISLPLSTKENTIVHAGIQINLDENGEYIILRPIDSKIPVEKKLKFDRETYPEEVHSVQMLEELIKSQIEVDARFEAVKFQLVYLYCKLYDTDFQEITFLPEFDITVDDHTIQISKRKQGDSKQYKRPKDFFGTSIDSIHAIIGKNGSGKSSIFELIDHCPLFRREMIGANEDFRYFIIYKIGNYYYYNLWGLGQKILLEEGIELYQYDNSGSMTLIKISNAFDPFAFSKHKIDTEAGVFVGSRENDSSIADLTTNSLMMSLVDESEFYAVEQKRYLNYKKIFQNRRNKKNNREDEFQIKWIDQKGENMLSSGERARLTIFSRLLSAFYVDKKYQDEIDTAPLSENYLILLDEAELYFHPEWQRTFIKDLCEFIEKINEKQKLRNITVLLSSNSPFYMSDLPEDCIHTLGNSEEQSINRSFGQNIYSLLKNKFFMQDGVIGGFAQKKIDEAFELLEKANSSDESMEKMEEVEYISSILGDSFLKHIMQDEIDRVKGE